MTCTQHHSYCLMVMDDGLNESLDNDDPSEASKWATDVGISTAMARACKWLPKYRWSYWRVGHEELRHPIWGWLLEWKPHGYPNQRASIYIPARCFTVWWQGCLTGLWYSGHIAWSHCMPAVSRHGDLMTSQYGDPAATLYSGTATSWYVDASWYLKLEKDMCSTKYLNQIWGMGHHLTISCSRGFHLWPVSLLLTD